MTRDTTSEKARALSTIPNVNLIQGEAAAAEQVFAQVQGGVQGVYLALYGFDADQQLKDGK